ncbi:MAG: hypothetical protein IPJ88_10820 [Myxococcales bacterium]|nr:MAG: hypothetical protein IPJ88_10820 [Myxococcales bacterium]
MLYRLTTCILISSLLFATTGCGAPLAEHDDQEWIDNDNEASALGLGPEFVEISAILEAIAAIAGGAALAVELALVAVILFIPTYLYVNSGLFEENLTTVKQLWYMVGAWRQVTDLAKTTFVTWYQASLQELRLELEQAETNSSDVAPLASAFAQLVTQPELVANVDNAIEELSHYELSGVAAELTEAVTYYREYSLIAQAHFPDLLLDASFAEEWFQNYWMASSALDLHKENRELGLPPGYNGQHDGTGTDHLAEDYMENTWLAARIKELTKHFDRSIPDLWVGVAKCQDFSLATFTGTRGPYGVGYGPSKQTAMLNAMNRLTDPLGPNAMRIQNHGFDSVSNACNKIPLFGQSLKGQSCVGSQCLYN